MSRKIILSMLAVLWLGCQFSFAGDDQDKKGRKKPDPEAAFKKLDANSDGKLSREEFDKMRENLPEKIKERAQGKGNGQFSGKMFDLMDANKDGFISLEEFKKARERVADRVKKGKGKGDK